MQYIVIVGDLWDFHHAPCSTDCLVIIIIRLGNGLFYTLFMLLHVYYYLWPRSLINSVFLLMRNLTENVLSCLENVVCIVATILFRVLCVKCLDSFSPGQNGCRFTDNIFKCIFMNENFCISIRISPKFAPKGPIDKKSALVQVMAWRRTGDKPLPEPMLTQFTDAYMWH